MTIETSEEHEHRPVPGSTIDARSGQHVALCTCGLRIFALTPGHIYGDWRPLVEEARSVVDPLGLERCALCSNAFGYDADEAATYRWRTTGHAGFVCRTCADEVPPLPDDPGGWT
jgi:hypothetical protein